MDAVQSEPAGVRVKPRVIPVRVAVPSEFCVMPVKDTNSERVVCGSTVPYAVAVFRYAIV